MKILIGVLLALLSASSMADGNGFLSTEYGIETVAKFFVSCANVIGIGLIFYGLFGFYKMGEDPRTYTISWCIGRLGAGTLLLISATAYQWTVNSGSSVQWASDASMLAIGEKINDDIGRAHEGFLGKYLPEGSIKTLMGFVYLVGLIGYLRGLYLLKDAGTPDANHSGGFYKAFWHIAGGAATMNILSVGCFFSWLLGISVLCSG